MPLPAGYGWPTTRAAHYKTNQSLSSSALTRTHKTRLLLRQKYLTKHVSSVCSHSFTVRISKPFFFIFNPTSTEKKGSDIRSGFPSSIANIRHCCHCWHYCLVNWQCAHSWLHFWPLANHWALQSSTYPKVTESLNLKLIWFLCPTFRLNFTGFNTR